MPGVRRDGDRAAGVSETVDVDGSSGRAARNDGGSATVDVVVLSSEDELSPSSTSNLPSAAATPEASDGNTPVARERQGGQHSGEDSDYEDARDDDNDSGSENNDDDDKSSSDDSDNDKSSSDDSDNDKSSSNDNDNDNSSNNNSDNDNSSNDSDNEIIVGFDREKRRNFTHRRRDKRRSAVLAPFFSASTSTPPEYGSDNGKSRSAGVYKRQNAGSIAKSGDDNGDDDGDDDPLTAPHPWKTTRELARNRRHATTKKAKRALAGGVLVRRVRDEEEVRRQMDAIAATTTGTVRTTGRLQPSADADLARLYQARMREVRRDEASANERGGDHAYADTSANGAESEASADTCAHAGDEQSVALTGAASTDLSLSEDDLSILLDGTRDAERSAEMRTPVEFKASVSLLQHQREALHWMVQRENRPQWQTPSGGLLADEQGLGKTLTTLALIMSNGAPAGAAAPTLIVCPLSLLHQWAREITDRIDESMRPSVLMYHGAERTRSPLVLRHHTVVLTTYAMVQNEAPELGADGAVRMDCAGALFRVRWLRVVLDESQCVRNRFSRSARAVCLLEAQRRWCLTGTPIQNTVNDMYSQCLFLRYRFVRNIKHWNAVYRYPIERRGRAHRQRMVGFQRLRAALSPIMLRRTKRDRIAGRLVLNLPRCFATRRTIEFTPQERVYYDTFESRERSAFQQLLRDHAVMENYVHVLVMLTRMRQMCDHYALVKKDEMGQLELSRALRDYVATGCRVSRSMRARLWNVLNDEAECVCPMCTDAVRCATGSITPCGHLFCSRCLKTWLGEHRDCPLCRQPCEQRFVSPMGDLYEQLQREVQQEEDEAAAAAAAGSQCGGRIDDDNNANDCSAKGKSAAGAPSRTRWQQHGWAAGRNDGGGGGRREQKLVPSTKLTAVVNEVRTVIDGTARMRDGGGGGGGDDDDDDEEESSNNNNNNSNDDNDHVVNCGDAADQRGERGARRRAGGTGAATANDDKCLVFSQWTCMLDLCEDALLDAGIPVCRLDGQMNQEERERNLSEFRRNDARAMLVSLHAGGVGLNLTRANHVIMVDSWWNPALEEQAVARVHRLGQLKPVRVVRLVIANSVEQRVIELQEQKRAVMEGALGEGDMGRGADAQQRLGLRDLQRLFNVNDASAAHGGGRGGGA